MSFVLENNEKSDFLKFFKTKIWHLNRKIKVIALNFANYIEKVNWNIPMFKFPSSGSNDPILDLMLGMSAEYPYAPLSNNIELRDMQIMADLKHFIKYAQNIPSNTNKN